MNVIKLLEECTYRFVRSGGKGGQNVNKVSSKVLLQWEPTKSKAINEEEKSILLVKLENRLSNDLLFQITCDTSRSQWENREEANKKLIKLLQKSLTPKKKRIPVKISKADKRKRTEEKKLQSEKKANRKKINL
jgi:ribosome-associated protein